MSQDCLLCRNPIDVKLSIKKILNFKRVPQQLICEHCYQQFKRLAAGCRQCCRSGIFKDQLCLDCVKWHQKGFDLQNHSLYQYNEAMSEYMKRYKFQGDYQLRFVFADSINQYLRTIMPDRLIVPIPISEETWMQRGFNQVIGWLKVPYVDALMTVKHPRQSSLKRVDRLLMQQSFSVREEFRSKIINQDIILVDDVYTTGTTLRLAAQCLMKSGSHSVNSFTLAR